MLARTFAAVRGRVRSEPLGHSGGQRSGAKRTREKQGIGPSKPAIGRVSRLFKEVYEAERLNAGSMPLRRRPESVREIADVAISRMAQDAATQSVTIMNAAPGDLYAWCDRERILKVFLNLLSNAIRAAHGGGHVVIRAEARGNRIVIAVKDDGAGLDPRTWPFLFGEGWKDPHRKGEGLGLPVSRAIVNAHSGKIWVESALGRGSTFFFTLPIAPSTESHVSV